MFLLLILISFVLTVNTPSVKRQRRRQRHHPIEIHCDTPKSVPDPFPSVTLYTMDPMGSNLTLTQTPDARCVHTLTRGSILVQQAIHTEVIFLYMSHFAYACKTEGQNGISRLISALCVNCLSSIPEYSRLNHLDVYLV